MLVPRGLLAMGWTICVGRALVRGWRCCGGSESICEGVLADGECAMQARRQHVLDSNIGVAAEAELGVVADRFCNVSGGRAKSQYLRGCVPDWRWAVLVGPVLGEEHCG